MSFPFRLEVRKDDGCDEENMDRHNSVFGEASGVSDLPLRFTLNGTESIFKGKNTLPFD